MKNKENIENERKMSKKEWNKIWKERYDNGQQIVIDCNFEDLMEDYEVTSLSQQIMYFSSFKVGN